MHEKGWVKIFDIDNADILVTQEFDEKKIDSKSIIKVEARSGSEVHSMRLDCKTPADAYKYFSILSEQNIRDLLQCMEDEMRDK